MRLFLYFAVVITGTFLASPADAQCQKGDVNLDGTVNLRDIQPFRDILEFGPYQCEADGNYDGVVNLLDVSPILEELLTYQDSDFVDASVDGPGDFFWSTAAFGQNAINEPYFGEMFAGDTKTLYLYYSINGLAGEINIGAALNVATSVPEVIQFTEAGAYNFDIEIVGNPVYNRWQYPEFGVGQTMNLGDAFSIDDNLIVGMTAFNIVYGRGVLAEYTGGGPFLDLGYDPTAGVDGAFLFGKIEFTALAGGDVSLMVGPNDLGIVNDYEFRDASISAAQIHVILTGDVNLDSEVNLLDVQPFIDVINSGVYQAEADCNYDGVVDLLDVAPFIDVLTP